MGAPLRLLTDRGPELEGALFSQLAAWFGIEKLRTTAYRPQTNGMLERFHRTLNSMLAKFVAENQRDWCERVPVVMAAYRASVHETTGYTPNQLMLLRETRAPLDVVLGVPREERKQHLSPDDFIAEQQTRASEVYEFVRQNLGVAATRRKKDYDARVKTIDCPVGSWVWYYTPRRFTGKSPKWQKMYSGPYLVTRLILPSNAVIQKSRRSKPIVAHMDKLKICLGDHPTSWLTSADSADVTAITGRDDAAGNQNFIQPPTEQRSAIAGADMPLNDGEGDMKSARQRASGESTKAVAPANAELGVENSSSSDEARRVVPSRRKREPRYLQDFVRRVID
jgi:hypothetical protein